MPMSSPQMTRMFGFFSLGLPFAFSFHVMISLHFEFFVKLFSRRVLPCVPHSTSGRVALIPTTAPRRHQFRREPPMIRKPCSDYFLRVPL